MRKNVARGAKSGFIAGPNRRSGDFPAMGGTVCGDSDRVNGLKRSQMRVFYSGRVQGIGFRITAKSVASGFEVVGSVRNLPDGRVELVAEGAREELEAFRAGIRDSGLGHFITNEQISWADATNQFRGFEILRT
jgi:acylphosphatase